MGGRQDGGVPEDVLESLRSNPVLASMSEEALIKIAVMVSAETRAQVGNALGDVELFHGLSNEDLEAIQRISEPVVAEAGRRLYEEGDRGDRFFVIVRGSVELARGGDGAGAERLATLKAGQAFGELALLDDAPRTATARAVEPSYLIGIARDAFLEVLGGDSLAVRLLRNLSRAVSANTSQLAERDRPRQSPKDALAEYNRMVRARLLPRGLPHVNGFDISASTATSEHGEGAAAWDWFPLLDGRNVLALLKVDQPGLSAAHRLAAVRGLLRDFADDPVPDLGGLLDRVNRGLRAGWLDGVSGAVSCGLIAVSGDDRIEWAAAGEVGGTIVRAGGGHDDLVPSSPSLGSDDRLEFESKEVHVGPGDRLLVFSDGPSEAVILGRKLLAAEHHPGAKRALGAVIDRLRDTEAGADGTLEITAAVIARSGVAEGDDAENGAIARAAAAYEAGLEEEASRKDG